MAITFLTNEDKNILDGQINKNAEDIGKLSEEIVELSEQMNGSGSGCEMLFDSDTDAYETGVLLTDGTIATTVTSGGDKKNYIPMFDISGGDTRIQIKSYNPNGVASDYDNHDVWIGQFDADGQYISDTRKKLLLYPIGIDPDSGTYYGTGDLLRFQNDSHDFPNGAETTIVPVEGAKYAIVFNFFKGTSADIKVFRGDLTIYSGGIASDVVDLKEIVTELSDEIGNLKENAYNIANGNEALVSTVFGRTSGNNYYTDFSAIAIADMHGKFVSLDDAASLRDILATKAIIINAGDNINLKAKMNGEINNEVAEYMEKAIQHCVYHTMGQHECGWNSTSMSGGRMKENCMTHEEVFEHFIAPIRDIWGLPNLDTIYYYKDFDNTRLISLYQYNVPLIEDETDTTCYKYDRNTLWLGQEQIDWLVDTLNSVPDGYRVIILQHQLEADIVNDDKVSVFHDGTTNRLYGTYVTADKPTIDIVQAYINKTTINKTYTPSNIEKYPSDVFTVTVNADFTNAKGEFGHYLSGDAHVDFVGCVAGTAQRHVILTASNQSYDCYVNPTANNASRSIVSLLGYDYNRNFVRLGRVGQQYAMTGQVRMLEKVTLT